MLDVMLPGTDGVTLLKRMKDREELRDIPVIMATAKGSEYDKIQSLDLGADDYLVKPFGIMEMVSRVKAVLRRCKPKEASNLLKLDGLLLLDGQGNILSINPSAMRLFETEADCIGKSFLWVIFAKKLPVW